MIECLRQHPAFADLACTKPKQSVAQRLDRLCENMAAPSTLAPALLHAFKRFEFGLEPANDLEKRLFSRFDNMPMQARQGFKNTVKAFEGVPDHVKRCIYNPKYVNLPLNQPLSVKEFVEELSVEILKHGGQAEYPRARGVFSHVPPGIPRPRTESDPEFLPEPRTVVTPTICEINDLRQAGFAPEPDRWREEELIRECSVERDGEEVRVVCGNYRTVEDGCPNGATRDGVCLRVPTVHAGDSVDLTGYNFISHDARIRLQRSDDHDQEWLLDTHVIGDLTTPGEENVRGAMRVIADCRVEDHLVFHIPELRDGLNEFLPGDYRIRVEIPNPDRQYYDDRTVLSEDEPPSHLRSKWHRIHVDPQPEIPYRISLDRVRCTEETNGLGSDHVFIRFLVFGGTLDGGFGSRPAPDPWENEDVDSRESFPGNRTIFSGPFPNTLAVTILGFEVDSNAALREELMGFEAAFVHALEEIWEEVGPELSSIGTAIGDLVELVGIGWTALILGIAIAIALAIITVWALWAPPDPIITDFIVLPAEMVHFLTHPNNPLIDGYEVGTLNGIDVSVEPETKLENDYLEVRRYRSDDEDSTYRLRLRYTRTD